MAVPPDEAAYSPDSALVAFPRRKTPPPAPSPDAWDEDPRELWVARRDGSGARRLLAGRADASRAGRLDRFATPAFSVDGRRIYFLSRLWATSMALHVYDLDTGAEHYIRTAADLEVIPRGRFAGCLLVSDHTWNARTDSYYYPFSVVTPAGAEVVRIEDHGDNAAQDTALAGWRRRHVPPPGGAAADVAAADSARDPRCR